MKELPEGPSGALPLRRRAELRLHQAQLGSLQIESPPDDPRILQELQIHQIELELQNEELVRSEAKMAEGLERYTDLYDFAPVGYFTLTANSTIQQVNLSGASLVGVDRSYLVNRRFALLLPAEQRAGFNDFLKQVFAAESNCVGEFELSSSELAPKTVSIEARCIHPGRECRAVVMDVTRRRRAEEIVRRNESLFSALIQQAPVGIYVVDAGLHLRQINAAALPVFGGIHPLMGRPLSEIIHLHWPSRTADQILASFRHTLKTGESYLMPEFVEQRRDTRVKESYDWQIQRVTLPNGEQGVVCFFNNITERKQAEAARQKLEVVTVSNEKLKREILHRQKLEKALTKSERHARDLLEQSRQLQKRVRHVSHQILQAEEKLRKEISHELHDKISQLLLGINVHLGVFAREAETNPKGVRQSMVPLRRLVKKSVQTVHQFSLELCPLMLEELGLIPALRCYIDRFPKRKGRAIHFNAGPGVEALNNAKRIMLYRVAQEALVNVARHSRARVVKVSLSEIPGGVCLEIVDDGKGFDVGRLNSAKWSGRLGVTGMRERVEMVGGRFSVVSKAGTGTTIRAEVAFGRFKKLESPGVNGRAAQRSR